MKKSFTIGYVATAISPYFAEEYKVRENSEVNLKKILIYQIKLKLKI